MRKISIALLALAGTIVASPAAARALPHEVIRATDYQGFVAGWDGDAPFCTAIASQAEWDEVIRPAAVGGGNRPFSPPASLWRTHTILLIARSGPGGGDYARVLRPLGVDERRGRIRVNTSFTPIATSSFQANFWTGVSVRRPLAGNIDFVENGRTLCTIRLTPAQRNRSRR